MQGRISQRGTFTTSQASRYLQQLCKHFGHKTEVGFDEGSGTVTLPPGPVALSATEDNLVIEVTATDAAGLATARGIIDRHLERFAFREAFTSMDWQGVPAADRPAG